MSQAMNVIRYRTSGDKIKLLKMSNKRISVLAICIGMLSFVSMAVFNNRMPGAMKDMIKEKTGSECDEYWCKEFEGSEDIKLGMSMTSVIVITSRWCTGRHRN